MQALETFLIGAIAWTSAAGLAAIAVVVATGETSPAWAIVLLGIALQILLPMEQDWRLF